MIQNQYDQWDNELLRHDVVQRCSVKYQITDYQRSDSHTY